MLRVNGRDSGVANPFTRSTNQYAISSGMGQRLIPAPPLGRGVPGHNPAVGSLIALRCPACHQAHFARQDSKRNAPAGTGDAQRSEHRPVPPEAFLPCLDTIETTVANKNAETLVAVRRKAL